MPGNRYVCMAIIWLVSLVFIGGGAAWYADILHEPLSSIYVFPGVLIMFGAGFAFIGHKAVSGRFECERSHRQSEGREEPTR